jgi:hypothetical protein
MTGDMYKLRSIKSQVEHGEYRVDPQATADAMLRWMTSAGGGWHAESTLFELRGARPTQNECSNPDNGTSESMNATPGSPSTTHPIQVRWQSGDVSL